MLEMNSRTQLATPQGEIANRQSSRLLIALSLLLVALVVVLVKDREFWFGSFEAAESTAADSDSIPNPSPVAAPAKIAQAPVAKAATAKHLAPKTSTQAVADSSHKDAGPATTNSADSASTTSASPVVATNRVVLPPLDVEVVAGDSHRMVHSGSNVAKVEIPSDSNRTPAVTATVTLPTNAAGRERITAVVPELQQTVGTTYPLLGQHSRVQGSVVLQAIVGTDGVIEDLRALSGPAVLATAAQQAVRQWRFKPVLQNGQAVETKAKITVNFSIRISDDANAS
jgi:TonB family protein